MLPGLGFSEVLVVAILALLVVGPKDLPLMLRRVGQFTAKMRSMAAEFRAGFDELARQAELDQLKKEVQSLRQAKPLQDFGQTMTDFVNGRDLLASDPGPQPEQPAPTPSPVYPPEPSRPEDPAPAPSPATPPIPERPEDPAPTPSPVSPPMPMPFPGEQPRPMMGERVVGG